MKKLILSLMICLTFLGKTLNATLCEKLISQSGIVINELKKDPSVNALLALFGSNTNILNELVKQVIEKICQPLVNFVAQQLQNRQSDICNLLKNNLVPAIDSKVKDFIAGDTIRTALENNPQTKAISSIIAPIIAAQLPKLLPQLENASVSQCPQLIQLLSSEIVK